MSRPLDRNGFGLTVADAEREVRAIETGMIFLPDSDAVYREWRRIVVQHSVLGVQVHDARLAAAMYVHRVNIDHERDPSHPHTAAEAPLPIPMLYLLSLR
jgi:hypothetical protein